MRKLILTIAFSCLAFGQTKALSHAIHAVDDLDTTLAFYRDVMRDLAGRAAPFEEQDEAYAGWRA